MADLAPFFGRETRLLLFIQIAQVVFGDLGLLRDIVKTNGDVLDRYTLGILVSLKMFPIVIFDFRIGNSASRFLQRYFEIFDLTLLISEPKERSDLIRGYKCAVKQSALVLLHQQSSSDLRNELGRTQALR
ncbi:MAG: hypothetical protein LOY00_06795 [Methylocaldum sp.]|nr:hypothetical protein [Methylocaldum sp.]